MTRYSKRPVSYASQSYIYVFVYLFLLLGAHVSVLPQVQEILFAARKK